MQFLWKNDVPLEDVLSKKIRVPDYQRDYAWSEEEATDFFKDLVDYVKSDDESYLLGQFIFYREDGQHYIIDGQQRITTSVILLSIIRNIVSELDVDKGSEEYIMMNSCFLNTIGSDSSGYKLVLTGNGKAYFKEYIQKKNSKPTTSGKYKATKNMKKVFDCFQEEITKYIDSSNDDIERFYRLNKLVIGLTDGFRVSTIITEDLGKAYTVFETLNSRGKDLDASDLLKNYFFKKCPNNVEYIKDEWLLMSSKIEEINESITQAIKCYWNSKYSFVRERQLYRTVSGKLSTQSDVDKFLGNFFKIYPYYISLCDSEVNSNFKDPVINESIKGLNILGAKLYRPLILASVEMNADESVIKKMLKTIEKLIVRNVVIGPDKANKYEERFSEWAIMINSSKITPESVIDNMTNMILDDESFKVYFNRFSPKESLARYILCEIYNHENGSELKINPNPKIVNVEHIMPKNIDKWPDVDPNIHEEYLYYLGNQTLLINSDNTSASNKDFISKKEIYSRSSLEQNYNYFSAIQVWNKDTILKRQDVLFNTAKKRW